MTAKKKPKAEICRECRGQGTILRVVGTPQKFRIEQQPCFACDGAVVLAKPKPFAGLVDEP